jgi:hypothetical protein
MLGSADGPTSQAKVVSWGWVSAAIVDVVSVTSSGRVSAATVELVSVNSSVPSHLPVRETLTPAV